MLDRINKDSKVNKGMESTTKDKRKEDKFDLLKKMEGLGDCSGNP